MLLCLLQEKIDGKSGVEIGWACFLRGSIPEGARRVFEVGFYDRKKPDLCDLTPSDHSTMLGGLGFVRSGRSRSPAVGVFSAGFLRSPEFPPFACRSELHGRSANDISCS